MHCNRRARVSGQLGLAPLIDVVFLLLLFFMLTSSFSHHDAIALDIPSSSTADSPGEQPLRIAVDSVGDVFVDGISTSSEALTARVRRALDAADDRAVALEVHARLDVQTMIHVVDRIRAAGARSIAFITRHGSGDVPPRGARSDHDSVVANPHR